MADGCMCCIQDVITQFAADLLAFNIIPWKINEMLFMDPSGPDHHKFNSVKGSIINTDIVPGSVSIFKKESNGYGHAVDVYGLDEIYGGINYNFGSVLINGVGSYNLNVGKNAKFTSKINQWNFGVEKTIVQDWITPAKGLNPLENIFGELNVGIPGEPTACTPVIKKQEIKYFNEVNDHTIGNYTSKFFGFPAVGVNMPGLNKLGCFGIEVSYFYWDLPNCMFGIGDLAIKLSVFENNKIDNYAIEPYSYFQDYKIDNIAYNLNHADSNTVPKHSALNIFDRY